MHTGTLTERYLRHEPAIATDSFPPAWGDQDCRGDGDDVGKAVGVDEEGSYV